MSNYKSKNKYKSKKSNGSKSLVAIYLIAAVAGIGVIGLNNDKVMSFFSSDNTVEESNNNIVNDDTTDKKDTANKTDNKNNNNNTKNNNNDKTNNDTKKNNNDSKNNNDDKKKNNDNNDTGNKTTNNDDGTKENTNTITTYNLTLKDGNEVSVVYNDTWKDPGYTATGSDGKNYNDKVKVTGTVNTKVAGTYKLTYTLTVDGVTKSVTRNVKVVKKEIAISSVKCDKSEYNVYYGDSITINKVISPTDTTNKEVKYASSKKGVAKVSSNGVITTQSKGTTTITITSKSNTKIKGTCTVNVIEAILFDKTKYELEVGKKVTVVPTVHVKGKTASNITWKSNDTNIVTIDSNGKITAKRIGTATVSATIGKITKEAKVTVTCDNPIASNGTINNACFGITKTSSNQNKATENSIGFTAAINYANSKKISTIKLEKGTYYIYPVLQTSYSKQRKRMHEPIGFFITKSINIDLNGSTIKQKQNSHDKSYMFYIGQVSGVSVYNGEIIGDYKNHLCKDGTKWTDYYLTNHCSDGSHGGSHAFEILDAQSVNLHDLKISYSVGDGVYIDSSLRNGAVIEGYKFYNTKNITINKVTVNTTGRNAVSVIDGNTVTISNCNFTKNRHGVDAEPNPSNYDRYNGSSKLPIQKLTISGNTITNSYKTGEEIKIHASESVTIKNNKIDNKVLTCAYYQGDTPSQRKCYNTNDEAVVKKHIILKGNTCKGVACNDLAWFKA